MPDLARERLIAAATELHDREGCTCDRKYLMSCPRMAAAILRAPKNATVEHPTEKCRSCPAQVIWAVTERGKTMPVDAEPGPGGNVQLVEQYGQLTAVIVPAKRAFGRKDLRKSHFVTCPQADQWRRRR